jgi:hypothetical protein
MEFRVFAPLEFGDVERSRTFALLALHESLTTLSDAGKKQKPKIDGPLRQAPPQGKRVSQMFSGCFARGAKP